MAQEVTTLKQIEQGRATYAYDAVKRINESKELAIKGRNKIKELDKEEAKRLKESYKSAAKKLPVLIKTNGLGQSLAFLKSKGADEGKPENAHDKLYEHIGTWLQTKDVKGLVPQNVELVKEVIELPSPTYRQVTVETLALLNWMRRFVDGLMKDVKEKEEVEESS